jgi:MFS family permease
LGIERELLLAAVMVGSLVMIPALLACGAASDQVRAARRLPARGAACRAPGRSRSSRCWSTASPVADRSPPSAMQLVFVSMMYGPQAALFAELFPKTIRYSGASLGYQIGAVAGGGFAPIIATALFAKYQSSLPISIYLAAMPARCRSSACFRWCAA